MLLGTLGVSLFGKMLTGKGIVRAGYVIRLFFIPPHPLTNFGIQKYYQNEHRFNGVYSGDNLPKKIKEGAYVINLGEYADIDTNWIALYNSNIAMIFFDKFGVKHVPIETEKLIGHKNIKTIIFRIQTNNIIMCGYFCVGFIDFTLAGKTLIDYASLFSHYNF